MIQEPLRDATVPELRARAHDIRNLFGAIASARHMFADDPDTGRREQLLDAIEDAAMRGGALTSRLLACASTSPADIDPGAQVQRLVPLLRSIIGTDARLVLDVGSCPATLRVDPEAFDNVVLELVTNAQRAICAGGTVRVGLRMRGARIRLIVADDGRGMPPEAARQLLTGAQEPGVRGTGFQLVRDFASRAHGIIRVRSATGRGTLVAITLPVVLHLHRLPALSSAAKEPGTRRRRRR